MNANIKLIDLAEKLNLSITTVSKALKGYKDVSDATREKVLKLAQELNYTPNAAAVNLRTAYTKTIGLIIPTTVHHFFSLIIQGILDEAEKHDYLVIILQSNESYELEKKQIDLLINHRVDGILLSLSNETEDYAHIQNIINQKKTLVLFDKIAKSVLCNKVIIDDKQAAYQAVSYLISRGYKKIAHFRGPYPTQISIDRFIGYKNALEDHGLVYDSSLVYVCRSRTDFDDGYANAEKLLKNHPKVEAVFCITDLVAIGVLKYTKEKAIKVPEDLAIFGFSNWFMSDIIEPKLSTVEQPGVLMGQEAAKLLIESINAKKNNEIIVPKTIMIPTQLVIRNSTK